MTAALGLAATGDEVILDMTSIFKRLDGFPFPGHGFFPFFLYDEMRE